MPQFITEIHADLRVLVVDGELDIASQESFRAALHALDTDARGVLIDFCRCAYFDSSALAELFYFRRMRAPKQHVSLAMPNAFGRRILTITHADSVFPIVDCVHAA